MSTQHPDPQHPDPQHPDPFEHDLAEAARRVAEQESREAAERQQQAARTFSGGRHPVNVGHLVMGLVFLAFVAVWALVQTEVVAGDDIRWLLPLPWVLGGAVGLAVAAVSGTRRHAGTD